MDYVIHLWGQVIVQGVAIGATLTGCALLVFTMFLPVTAVRIWKNTTATLEGHHHMEAAGNPEPKNPLALDLNRVHTANFLPPAVRNHSEHL